MVSWCFGKRTRWEGKNRIQQLYGLRILNFLIFWLLKKIEVNLISRYNIRGLELPKEQICLKKDMKHVVII